jgi:cytochrome oxidase Cu insertion factor (SCO1/SenC/PrrC family)
MQVASPRRARLLNPLFVAWMAIPLVAALGLLALLIPRGAGTGPSGPSLMGTVIHGATHAPDFDLRDQAGQAVTLQRLRGKVVIVTFVESHCTGLCPRVVDKLHQVDVELGPTAKRLRIVAISVDPERDTSASIRAFSQEHGMVKRWLYLTAPRSILKNVWRHYYVYAAPPGAPAQLDTQHTSATFLIDTKGNERVLMGGDINSSALEHDVRLLLGLPDTTAVTTDPAPEVGHPAPDFTLRTTTGKTVSLRSLRGKVVLLNFWATWCHPCRTEMPRLSAWYTSLRSRGFTVIGVDSLQSGGTVASYVKSLNVRYPVVLDGDGNVGAVYDVVATPTSYLIDRHGIVRSRIMGMVNPTFLTQKVRPVVAGGNVTS